MKPWTSCVFCYGGEELLKRCGRVLDPMVLIVSGQVERPSFVKVTDLPVSGLKGPGGITRDVRSQQRCAA